MEYALALACGQPPMIQFAVKPNLEKIGYDVKESLMKQHSIREIEHFSNTILVYDHSVWPQIPINDRPGKCIMKISKYARNAICYLQSISPRQSMFLWILDEIP
ncbi:Nitrate reductase [Forsythia ovata]|uniref:Nitrate reductase n=1 Tax=Forsythia ovata TaxID=205694 RepID=A0ABD1VM63_9LAMI